MINRIVDNCIQRLFVNCSTSNRFSSSPFDTYFMITLRKCAFLSILQFFFSFAFCCCCCCKTWQTFWPTQWLTKLPNLFCGILRKVCALKDVYIRFGIFFFFSFSLYLFIGMSWQTDWIVDAVTVCNIDVGKLCLFYTSPFISSWHREFFTFINSIWNFINKMREGEGGARKRDGKVFYHLH